MAPHSITLAWKIPWMEEPGRLQSMGSLRVGHNSVTSLSLFTFMYWRRKWQPTLVFLSGESQGQQSLVGCHLWGCKESDTTEATQQQQQQQQQVSHSFSSKEQASLNFMAKVNICSDFAAAAAAAKSLQSCPTLCDPTDWTMQPTRLPRPWDSPGKNTGVGCRFLLQYMKVKSESEVTQSCPTQRPQGVGALQNKVCHFFHCFPIYLPGSDGTRCPDLSFLNAEF